MNGECEIIAPEYIPELICFTFYLDVVLYPRAGESQCCPFLQRKLSDNLDKQKRAYSQGEALY